MPMTTGGAVGSRALPLYSQDEQRFASMDSEILSVSALVTHLERDLEQRRFAGSPGRDFLDGVLQAALRLQKAGETVRHFDVQLETTRLGQRQGGLRTVALARGTGPSRAQTAALRARVAELDVRIQRLQLGLLTPLLALDSSAASQTSFGSVGSPGGQELLRPLSPDREPPPPWPVRSFLAVPRETALRSPVQMEQQPERLWEGDPGLPPAPVVLDPAQDAEEWPCALQADRERELGLNSRLPASSCFAARVLLAPSSKQLQEPEVLSEASVGPEAPSGSSALSGGWPSACGGMVKVEVQPQGGAAGGGLPSRRGLAGQLASLLPPGALAAAGSQEVHSTWPGSCDALPGPATSPMLVRPSHRNGVALLPGTAPLQQVVDRTDELLAAARPGNESSASSSPRECQSRSAASSPESFFGHGRLSAAEAGHRSGARAGRGALPPPLAEPGPCDVERSRSSQLPLGAEADAPLREPTFGSQRIACGSGRLPRGRELLSSRQPEAAGMLPPDEVLHPARPTAPQLPEEPGAALRFDAEDALELEEAPQRASSSRRRVAPAALVLQHEGGALAAGPPFGGAEAYLSDRLTEELREARARKEQLREELAAKVAQFAQESAESLQMLLSESQEVTRLRGQLDHNSLQLKAREEQLESAFGEAEAARGSLEEHRALLHHATEAQRQLQELADWPRADAEVQVEEPSTELSQKEDPTQLYHRLDELSERLQGLESAEAAWKGKMNQWQDQLAQEQEATASAHRAEEVELRKALAFSEASERRLREELSAKACELAAESATSMTELARAQEELREEALQSTSSEQRLQAHAAQVEKLRSDSELAARRLEESAVQAAVLEARAELGLSRLEQKEELLERSTREAAELTGLLATHREELSHSQEALARCESTAAHVEADLRLARSQTLELSEQIAAGSEHLQKLSEALSARAVAEEQLRAALAEKEEALQHEAMACQRVLVEEASQVASLEGQVKLSTAHIERKEEQLEKAIGLLEAQKKQLESNTEALASTAAVQEQLRSELAEKALQETKRLQAMAASAPSAEASTTADDSRQLRLRLDELNHQLHHLQAAEASWAVERRQWQDKLELEQLRSLHGPGHAHYKAHTRNGVTTALAPVSSVSLRGLCLPPQAQELLRESRIEAARAGRLGRLVAQEAIEEREAYLQQREELMQSQAAAEAAQEMAAKCEARLEEELRAFAAQRNGLQEF